MKKTHQKRTFLCALSLFLLALAQGAQAQNFQLKNLDMAFEQGHGQFSIEEIGINAKAIAAKLRQVHYDLTLTEESIRLENQDQNVSLPTEIYPLVKMIKVLNFEDTNATLEPGKKLEVEAGGMALTFNDGAQIFRTMKILCHNSESQQSKSGEADDLFKFCLNDAQVSIGKLLVHDSDLPTLAEMIPKTLRGIGFTPAKVKEIQEIKATVKKNNLNGEFKFKFLINFKVTTRGIIQFIQNESGKKITFDVDQIKIGFIPVKKIALWLLGKSKMQGIKVIGDRIELQMK